MSRETKISIVKSIKGDTLYIDKQKDDIEKDYFAQKKYCDIFDDLKEGDTVEFQPFKNSNGKWVAQNIKKFSPSSDIILSQLVHDDNHQDIVDYFISYLNEKANTTNWREFEDISLFVLKSLGVSEIYPTPQEDGRGKCDGIFKIIGMSTNTPRLEVFYDCTLEEDFSKKSTQIENYISQISKSNIQLTYKLNVNNVLKSIKETVSLNNTAVKQVWIITKNKTRFIENKQIDVSSDDSISISVKEISIFDLILIVKNKFLDKSFSKIDNILDELKSIGQ